MSFSLSSALRAVFRDFGDDFELDFRSRFRSRYMYCTAAVIRASAAGTAVAAVVLERLSLKLFDNLCTQFTNCLDHVDARMVHCVQIKPRPLTHKWVPIALL
jgi:hypothetical protein